MKAVILAGGLGTRISEETVFKPKPMIEIGGKPILWHIMKIYSFHGINDFIICCGYKGYVIKEYFANYFLHQSDITFDMSKNTMKIHQERLEPWKVTLIDTGEQTMTGGRIIDFLSIFHYNKYYTPKKHFSDSFNAPLFIKYPIKFLLKAFFPLKNNCLQQIDKEEIFKHEFIQLLTITAEDSKFKIKNN